LLNRPKRLAESAQASCTADNEGDAVGTPANESAAWDGSDAQLRNLAPHMSRRIRIESFHRDAVRFAPGPAASPDE
jgi:hypothetical protein